MRDFYSTMAQVFPVLMLAIVWESAYLDRLRTRSAASVRFWTKKRVRVWTILVVLVTVFEIALVTGVLANLVAESSLTKWTVLTGLGVVLGTILVRALVDIWDATSETVAGGTVAGGTVAVETVAVGTAVSPPPSADAPATPGSAARP